MSTERLRVVFVTTDDRTQYLNVSLASLAASQDPTRPPEVEVLRVCQPAARPSKLSVSRNHIAALRLGAAGPGGFVVVEDDVLFRPGWVVYLRSLDPDVIRTLYVRDGGRVPGPIADPPKWWGQQGMWWPREEALAFADWFEKVLVYWPDYPVDGACRDWIMRSKDRGEQPRWLWQCPVDLVEHQQHPITLPGSYDHKSGTFRLPWPAASRPTRIEIEITTACNMTCGNCDRSAAQAPSKEAMTVDQIRHFVAESHANAWRWNEIVLIGGEPTLHPNFLEITTILRGLKPGRLVVATNGKNAYVVRGAGAGLHVQRQNDLMEYDAFNHAPCDLGMKARGQCWIPRQSGMGLCRYGYYFCGCAAGIDRVFGFGVGVLNLSDWGKMEAHTGLLCGVCGHWHGRKARDLPGMSKSWVDAYAAYRERQPSLPLYGAAAVSGSAPTSESSAPAGTV
jgi:hypothetical protein